MCIQIDNPITVTELVERWKDIDVDGVKFDFHTIIEMFKAGEFNIYRKVAPSPRNGKMGYKCEEFTESMKDFMQFPDDGKYYILDLLEIERYELNFKKEFTPSFSDVCARFQIPENQLLRMLYSMAKGKEVPNLCSSSQGWSITTRINDVSTAFFYDGDPKEKLAEIESILTLEKAENEKLKARIAELESTPQKGAESEEITSLRWELGKLGMSLEDSEKARQGLSDELEVKTLELAHVRQELKALQAVPGENPGLPTNIKTVLRMLQEQKSDREIAQALYNGGGNSGMSQAQVKALLWRGDEFPAEQSIKNAMKELFLPVGKSTL